MQLSHNHLQRPEEGKFVFLEVKTLSGRRSRCHFSAIPELSSVGCAANPCCGQTSPMLHRRSKNKLAGFFKDDITSFFFFFEEGRKIMASCAEFGTQTIISCPPFFPFFSMNKSSLVWRLFIFSFPAHPAANSVTPAGPLQAAGSGHGTAARPITPAHQRHLSSH